MTGWLVVNGFLKNNKFNELTQLFLQAAKNNRIILQVKENKEYLADIDRGIEEKPDFVIFWDKDLLLAEYLELEGIPVYNSSRAIAICDDKRETHMALRKAGVPMPRTIMAPMTYEAVGFTSLDFISEIENRLKYPMIIKEAFGSFGEQVYKADDRETLLEILAQCNTEKLLFQEYIACSCGKDVRLQVVGEKVVAAMFRHSETDFRANITAGGKMDAYEPSEQERLLALQAARAVGADFAGVDLLFGEKGPLVCEVNSNAHFKNLLDCTGVNTADEIFQYIQEKV